MSSADFQYRPLWHRLAWLTVVLALLPVTVGAAVTTLDAGMAFRDWPTSNGYGMLQYPWLQSFGETDKFLEHGHRLAGLLIGFLTLVTAILTWVWKAPQAVRFLATGILLAVIGQGLLGGVRVLLDASVFAMIHGWFAAIVCGLLAWQVMLTGPHWNLNVGQQLIDPAAERLPNGDLSRSLNFAAHRILSWGLLAAVAVQYVLGGLLRHLKNPEAWMFHPWFAVVVLILAVATWWSARQTQLAPAIRIANFVMAIVGFQLLLGLATWATKYGFPDYGIMAYHNSSFQTAACTLHKVFGLLTWMGAFAAVVRMEHESQNRATVVRANAGLMQLAQKADQLLSFTAAGCEPVRGGLR